MIGGAIGFHGIPCPQMQGAPSFLVERGHWDRGHPPTAFLQQLLHLPNPKVLDLIPATKR